MAGDPLRDAFRTKLAAIVAAASIPWPVQDTLNTGTQPDAAASFIDLEFNGGQETEYTFGAPGSNLWKETGQVMVRLYPARNIGHDLLETYALAIRNALRHARFVMSTGQTVRLDAVSPLGGGFVDAGWWCETIGISYTIYNTG